MYPTSYSQILLTLKLTGGGGFFGSILTTLDSTFGGGRKLFLPTYKNFWEKHVLFGIKVVII